MLKISAIVLFIGLVSFQNLEAKNYDLYGKTRAEKAFKVSLETSYFYKTATFDNNGDIQNMDPGESFYLIDSELNLNFAFGPDFELYGGGRYRFLESSVIGQTISNSNLESYFLGAKYYLGKWGQWFFSLGGSYRQAAYSNNLYDPGTVPSDDLILGDDGGFIKGSLLWSWALAREHFLEGEFVYHLPPEHLSDEIIYDIHYSYQGNDVRFNAGLLGVFSLETDSYRNDPENRPEMARGVTALFNGLNRQYLAPYADLQFFWGKWGLGFNGRKIFSGRSTDEGFGASVRLMWLGKGVSTAGMEDKKFKEYTNSALVLKISPRGNFIKIDQGISTDIEKGTRVDIYQSDFFGGNVLVASGEVFSVDVDTSIVKIMKIYQKIPIKKGFVVRIR